MVLGPDFSPRLLSMGDSRQKGSFPFGSLTSKSLIMRVQWEHWMHTSTELPHGEGGPIARMLWYPKMDLPATNQTFSRWIVDAINTAYGSSQLPSSDGSFIRHWVWRPPRPFSQVSQCRTSAMLQDGLCPNLCQILWPWHAGHSRLFSPLTLDVLRRDTYWAGTWKTGSVGISSPMRFWSQLEFLKRNVSRLCV